MKATVRKFACFGWAAVLAAVSAFAEVVDVTDRLEYLFNPGHEHWGGHKLYEAARGVKTLAYLDGRIYVALGDYSNNLGPVPIVSIGVGGETPTFRTEYVAGTEQIDKFKKLSDGRIWAVSVDPRLGSGFSDVLMTKRDGEAWRPTSNVSNQPFLDKYHAQGGSRTRPYEHVWDFCDYKGTLFFGGYDIMKSETWLRGDEALTNQAAGCTIMDNVFACMYDDEKYAYMRVLARMVSLMPFDNGLVCWHLNTRYWKNGKIARDPQMWRYDETTGLFTEENTTYDTFIPGWNAVDWELQTSKEQYLGNVGFDDIKKFAGRLFYVVQDGGMEFYSMGFYSATMDAAGNISAKKVVLDDGHAHVVRTCIVDGVMYCLAQHPWGEDGLMTQSLWKTTDGEAFTKFAEFRANHACQAMTYANGWFYVGYGYHQTLATAEVVAESGKIFRFYLPQEPVALVADRTSVEVAEGGATNVFLRLSSAPETNVTVRIALESDNHTFTLSPATLTFTPSNWNVAQEAAIGCPKPAEGDAPAGTLFLGTPGTPECTDLAIQVTPLKDAAAQDDPVVQDDPAEQNDPVVQDDPAEQDDSAEQDDPAVNDGEEAYVWRGGNGFWGDASKWTKPAGAASAVPGEGCSVTFGADDSDVVITNDLSKLKDVVISSAGTHVFRTTYPTTKFTMKSDGGSIRCAGTGGGTLVFNNIVVDGKITDLAGLKQLAIVNNGQAFPANSETTDILLVSGGCIYSGWENGKVFGKLILQGGPCRISGNYTFSFAALETRRGSGVSSALVVSDKVTIRDRSTVEMVGGTQTLEDYQPHQVPVCTQFLITGNDGQRVRYGKNLCTIDSNGLIRMIPLDSMLTILEDATELDNVCFADGATLTQDLTVNAALFSGATVNLGGHTLTVKSGQCREGTAGMWSHVVSNGTVRLCKPNAVGDSTNNSDVRLKVDFETEGNDDLLKPMLAHDAMNTGWAYLANYADFTGVVTTPVGKDYYLKTMTAPKMVLELNGSRLTAQTAVQKGNFGGLAGVGYINYSYNGMNKYSCNIWLGEMSAEDRQAVESGTVNGSVTVGTGGIICPGLVGYDGGRRGAIKMSYMMNGTVPMLKAFSVRTGGRFITTLNADGTCGSVDCTGVSTAGGAMTVELGGSLELTTAGKVASTTEYPIITYRNGQLTGRFSAVSKNFKVKYDAVVDENTRAVVVSKRRAGFVAFFR